jgi:hypothetical protein
VLFQETAATAELLAAELEAMATAAAEDQSGATAYGRAAVVTAECLLDLFITLLSLLLRTPPHHAARVDLAAHQAMPAACRLALAALRAPSMGERRRKCRRYDCLVFIRLLQEQGHRNAVRAYLFGMVLRLERAMILTFHVFEFLNVEPSNAEGLYSRDTLRQIIEARRHALGSAPVRQLVEAMLAACADEAARRRRACSLAWAAAPQQQRATATTTSTSTPPGASTGSSNGSSNGAAGVQQPQQQQHGSVEADSVAASVRFSAAPTCAAARKVLNYRLLEASCGVGAFSELTRQTNESLGDMTSNMLDFMLIPKPHTCCSSSSSSNSNSCLWFVGDRAPSSGGDQQPSGGPPLLLSEIWDVLSVWMGVCGQAVQAALLPATHSTGLLKDQHVLVNRAVQIAARIVSHVSIEHRAAIHQAQLADDSSSSSSSQCRSQAVPSPEVGKAVILQLGAAVINVVSEGAGVAEGCLAYLQLQFAKAVTHLGAGPQGMPKKRCSEGLCCMVVVIAACNQLLLLLHAISYCYCCMPSVIVIAACHHL